MAVEIKSYPGTEVRFAGQPLIFTVGAVSGDPVPERFVVQIFRSYTNDGNNFSERAKLYITPNASNVCHFDLSQIAEGELTYPVDKDDVVVHAVEDSAKVFYCDGPTVQRYSVRVGRYDDGTENLDDDSEDIYLLRGTQQLSDGLTPSMNSYYPRTNTTKSWLTDREAPVRDIEVKMAEDDQGVAMFLVANNLGVSGVGSPSKVNVRQFNASGNFLASTDLGLSSTTLTRGQLIAVPVGPALWSHLGLHALTAKASFRVQESDSSIISVQYTVSLDCRPLKHDATQLAWINTRGGWDYLRFDARSPKNISVTGKEFRKSVMNYGASTFSLDGFGRQYDTFAKSGKLVYNLTSDFFDEDERQLLEYCMRSRVVHIRVGNERWKPATVRTSSLQIEPAGSKFYTVSLQVEIATDVRC